jgi:pimeloyl-ACP methyl ester carboxylesterase
VHLVGHSLGGIIARWYVQERGGDAAVDTAITVASPHQGTLAALLPFGRTAQQLRPGSWVLRRLAQTAQPSAVRWFAYYSNIDVLVQPGRSAMITAPALGATNLLVKDHGHLSILLSPRLARSIVCQLEAAEGTAGHFPIVPLRPAADPGTGTGGSQPDAIAT